MFSTRIVSLAWSNSRNNFTLASHGWDKIKQNKNQISRISQHKDKMFSLMEIRNEKIQKENNLVDC